jgi:hypothetical protein
MDATELDTSGQPYAPVSLHVPLPSLFVPSVLGEVGQRCQSPKPLSTCRAATKRTQNAALHCSKLKSRKQRDHSVPPCPCFFSLQLGEELLEEVGHLTSCKTAA